MIHHRRKALLQELHGLYLDNFKNSQTWSHEQMTRMLGYFGVLRNKMEIDQVSEVVKEIQQLRAAADRQQLRLFD